MIEEKWVNFLNILVEINTYLCACHPRDGRKTFLPEKKEKKIGLIIGLNKSICSVIEIS
jgi:hypothetical protein